MIGAVNWWAFAIAVGTATIVIAVRRLLPRAPAFVVVVGHVDAGLPAPTLPSTSIRDVYDLLGAAVSVALLVLSSSMLTGSVLANRDHEKVSAPREFLGLAAACAGVGVLVSLLEVLRRPILPPTAVLGRLSGSPTWRNVDDYDGAKLLPGLLVYRFDAPLFFANAEVFTNELTELVDDSEPAVTTVLVNAEGIIDLDVTGADVLAKVVFDMRERGVRVMFARMRTPVLRTLSRLDLLDDFGADAFYLRMDDAVAALDPRPA